MLLFSIVLTMCLFYAIFLVYQEKSNKRDLFNKINELQLEIQKLYDEKLEHLIALKSFHFQLEEKSEQLFEKWKKEETEKIRADSVKKTRAVLRGKTLEHFMPPLFEEFDTRDFRWIGDPIDYLVCQNANLIHDGENSEINKIALIDVKTGNADLSKIQRRIRDAVVSGRVSFIVINPDTNTKREWECEKKKALTSPIKSTVENEDSSQQI